MKPFQNALTPHPTRIYFNLGKVKLLKQRKGEKCIDSMSKCELIYFLEGVSPPMQFKNSHQPSLLHLQLQERRLYPSQNLI